VSDINVVYLGSGKVLIPAVALRRWPVTLSEMRPRSLPGDWSDETHELASRCSEACRLLVAIAREARATKPHVDGVSNSLNMYVSPERGELLMRMFPCSRTNRRGDTLLTIDRSRVTMRLSVRRRPLVEPGDSDRLVVVVGDQRFSCHVAPTALDARSSELYAALRSDDIAISEALDVVVAMESAAAEA
jgi:hypothetical protein